MDERVFLRLPGDPPEDSAAALTEGARLRHYEVEASLRPWVAELMHCEETLPDGLECTERVLPDGHLRLVAHLGEVPEGTPRLLAIGASVSPVLLRLRGRMVGWSVTLRPGAAQALLGAAAAELPAEGLALDALHGAPARRLIDALATATSPAQGATRWQKALHEMLQPPSRRDEHGLALAAAARRDIERRGGAVRLGELASTLGVGERRLQQLFRAHVGLPPRSVARLVRLQACLRAVRAVPSVRWAELAADAGFSDQSHLVNEFQALCGLTPGEFLRRGVSRSSKTDSGDGP